MFKIIASLSVLVAVAHSFPKKEAQVYAYIKPAAPVLLEKEIEVKGKYPIPKYLFKYGVEDPKTGDKKSQIESREGDEVKGEYKLLQPDGTIRIVKYVAGKKEGFNAEVLYEGKPILKPEPPKKA